jgi:hypothetical protein
MPEQSGYIVAMRSLRPTFAQLIKRAGLRVIAAAGVPLQKLVERGGGVPVLSALDAVADALVAEPTHEDVDVGIGLAGAAADVGDGQRRVRAVWVAMRSCSAGVRASRRFS